ncbi:metal-sensing transcriptional repressor [Candidatus Berkelbacteria bacterium]|nr:metal-sensing transcriptional repressor [Candidatus Berkelbacteria bacterium]
MKRPAKQRALHRIKIIQGHLKKVEEMIAADAYCVDTITQSLAVQSSLKSLNKLLLAHHLGHCAVDQVRTGQAETMVKELTKLYELEARS